jgi:peptidoglycan-N-acetylglucosamine deacetylase
MSARALDDAAAPPWRPTPTVAASIGLHVAAGAGVLLHVDAWPAALAAVAANQGLLTAISMWPRSCLLGPNMVRLPAGSAARSEIAITFDDGPDPEVTPRLLDMLESAGARATFFCIAERALRHPELCREMIRRGHGIENHSLDHSHAFAFNGMGGVRRELLAAQSALREASGRVPRFFRPPAGVHSPLLDPVLHQLGLRLVSWTRRGFDTRIGNAGFVAARLTGRLAAGDILLLHDGHCAHSAAGTPVVLEVLPRVLGAARALNLRPVALHQAVAP